jgi:hypothetical protein
MRSTPSKQIFERRIVRDRKSARIVITYRKLAHPAMFGTGFSRKSGV